MEGVLLKVNDQTPPQGTEVAQYFKVHQQNHMMFLQTHQEALHLRESFKVNIPNS